MKKILFAGFLLTFSLSSVPHFSAATLIVPATSAQGEPDPARVNAALEEFRGLSKKERKERIREVKKEFKQYKKEKKSGNGKSVEQIVLIILAILLPPLAVYLYEEEVNNRFWISLLLWFLFILPGVIYALIIVTGSAD